MSFQSRRLHFGLSAVVVAAAAFNALAPWGVATAQRVQFVLEATLCVGALLVGLVVVGVIAVFVIVGLITGLVALLAPLGVLVGLMAGMILFGRFAQSAQYSAIEGQPGAAAAILQSMRGGWTVTPAVAEPTRSSVVLP